MEAPDWSFYYSFYGGGDDEETNDGDLDASTSNVPSSTLTEASRRNLCLKCQSPEELRLVIHYEIYLVETNYVVL
jgi:hypothetical protein